MTLLFLPITPLADGEALGFTVSCERFGSRRFPEAPCAWARSMSSARLERSQLAIVSSLQGRGRFPFMAFGKEETMPRRTPTTGLTVVAIGDAKARFRVLALRDQVLDQQEQECLLLLDYATYLAEKADLDRRRDHNDEDYGAPTPRLLREARELDTEYAHLLKAA